MSGSFIINDIKSVAGDKIEKLGSGAFAQVYKTSKNFAIKMTSIDTNGELPHDTIVEVSILKYLHHPNVINIIAMQLNPPIIVMPLVSITMEKYFSLITIINEEYVNSIFYQLFRGIAYCHSKYVWHLDLKPANILLSQDGVAVIADFGISRSHATPGGNRLDVITLWWKAPELLLGDENYSSSADVWSLGIMYYNTLLKTSILQGDCEIDQLYKTFKILGTPTDSEWPGVTALPEWNDAFPKWKETKLTVSNSSSNELINKTITWPNKRYSALDILKLSVFETVRDKIELVLPAAPISNESYEQFLLREECTPRLRTESEYKKVQNIFTLMYSFMESNSLEWRTLFYAMELIKACDNETLANINKRALAIAALNIGINLCETVSMFITNGVSDIKINAAIDKILTVTDFNILFPTCKDFLGEKLHTNDKLQDYVSKINEEMFRIMLQFKYSTFKPSEVTQLAIDNITTMH